MRIVLLALTPLLASASAFAHSDSVECRTKAVVEEVRPTGLLARGEMKCDNGDQLARTPVHLIIKDTRGPLPPQLIGQKVTLETDNGEQVGEICVGDDDSELLIGGRVGVFVMDERLGRTAHMRRIYGGVVNADGEVVTELRSMRARGEHRYHEHQGRHIYLEERRYREPVIKK